MARYGGFIQNPWADDIAVPVNEGRQPKNNSLDTVTKTNKQFIGCQFLNNFQHTNNLNQTVLKVTNEQSIGYF